MSRLLCFYERREMRTVRLITSVVNVDIKDDLIALYTTEDKPSEGVVIPLYCCSIMAVYSSADSDSEIIFVFSMKYKQYKQDKTYLNGKPSSGNHRHIKSPKNQNLKFPRSVYRITDDMLSFYYDDDDLARLLLKYLSIIENFNYKYLSLYENDIAAIKEVSETVHTVKKAKKIVSKKLLLHD